MARSTDSRAFLRATMLGLAALAASTTFSAERPLLVLGSAPSGALAGGDGPWRTLPSAAAEAAPRLVVEDGALPEAPAIRVRARFEALDAASAAGVALVEGGGAWVAAGVTNGRPVLAPSDGRWTATPAEGPARLAGPFWAELERVESGSEYRWSLRLWPDGAERPEAPAATATERRQRQPGETTMGVWLTGGARVADLQALALDASRSSTAAKGAPWPLELAGHALRITTADRETRDLELASLDAAAKSAAALAPGLKSGTSFPCNPYQYHYAGYAPGFAGSSALLHLPPLDNDCDGAFNEDPVNWRDDDGDGLVDEDPAWFGDGLLNWTSSDSRLGELATGDTGAVILVVRLCWPTRVYLTFATLTSDDIVLAGGVRLVPEGGGIAVVGHDWQAVEYLLSPATSEPLAVTIRESGAPLVDGTWLERSAVLTFPTSGGGGSVTIVATIDGAPYTPGTEYAVEGEHGIHVVATDGGGATAVADGSFGVDLSPSVFSDLEPASGEVVPSSPMVITGRISADAVEVLVAGAAATLGVPDGAMRPFTSAPITLVQGPQVLELVATDRVGKTTTAQLLLDLDTLAPAVVVDSPAEGSLHPSQPVTVTGAVVEAHLASLTVNGVAATLTGDRFTAEVALAEGGNTLTAVATDVFGRPGQAQVSVVLDTTAPDVSLATPSDGAVVGGSPITVGGHVEDPYLATVEVNGVAAVVAGTQFSAEGIVLAEGANTLTAVAADQAGNTAAAPTRVVVLDTLPPELTVSTAGLPTLTAAASVALAGTAVDPHLASVTVNGLPATLAGDAWSLTEIPLAEGESTLVVRAEDSLGHVAEAPPITIVRDSLAPALAITEPVDGAPLTGAEVTVRGTVADPHLDPATVTVNGVAATVAGDTFEVTLTLAEGETALTAEAADTLGHVGQSAAVTVTVDTLPPVVTLTVPLDPLVGAATVAVMGTVHEAHLESLTVAGIEAVVDGTGFSVDGVPLEVEGDNPVVAVARDAFGHEASSNVVVYVRDTTAPEIAITEPAEGAILTAAALVVSGTVADAHLETVTVNGVAATVAAGLFTAEIPASDGAFEIRAVATDAVGLTAEAAVTVLRDTLAPVVTVDQPALAAGGCLVAGQPVTVAGSLGEASPATGLDGQPPPIRLEVVRSDGGSASFVGVLSADGRAWSVAGVDLGAADGTAVATVIAADAAGHVSRASRSWRVDATPPTVTLLLDGAPFPGAGPGESPAPGAEPALLNRTVIPRVVVSDPGGAAPQPSLALDGAGFAPGTPIAAEGDHLLVARATDCAGRETVVHAFFRLDLTAPALTSTEPADGALLGEGVETFSGVSDPDLATATVNGRVATVTAGSFSLTPFAWREGENVVSIELVDEAGNRSSFERRFTVRSLEPTLELLVDGLPIPPGAVFTRAIAPVVRCSDPGAAVTATLDGAPFSGGTLLDATGDHVLSATATDALDRTVTASVSFRVDLEPAPTVTITSPADGDVLPEATATVAGSLTGAVETVTVNGLPAVVTGASFTAADVPLDPDGLTTLVAIAVDGAGRSNSDAVTVTVRSGAPQLLITEPEAGAVIARAAVDVAGLVLGGPGVTADGTVTVAGLVTPVADDGSFRVLDVPLAAGANTLEVSATDDHGRTGHATVTVVSDRTPPRVALTVDGQPVEEGAVYPGAVTVEIAVADDDSEPQPPLIRLDGATVPAAEAVVSVEIAAAGGHLLEVVATDLAGNEMRLERSLVIGGSGCAISALEPADGTAVAEDRATLRGDVRDAVRVVVRVPTAGGDPLELDATLADGTFVAGDVPLPEVGENVLTLVCTDVTGATAEQVLSLERLAGSGPVVVLTAPADGARLDLRKAAVSGTVDPATARVLVNGAELTVDPASGAFSAQLDLAEGPNALAATAVDGAGRVGRHRVVVWRDTRAPQVRLSEPLSGTIVGPDGDGQAIVRVAGVVDLTSEPHLGEVSVTTPAGTVPLTVDPVTGAFAAVVALDPALAGEPQQVRVSALDHPMGHEGVVAVSVTFDPSYPAIVLTEPAGLVLLDGSATDPIAVTGEAWAAEGAQVAVNGEGLQPDQVSWQGPDASGRFHTAFSVTVPAPTEDGARAIVAQVTELGGARAQTLRTVVRDSVPPQLLELAPADGANGVDPDTLLFALFSEAVRIPSLAAPDGLTLERLGTATTVAAERTVAGTAVALVPAARLAEGESYRLAAGLGVVDVVGNPLATPGASVFETAVGGVGAAPVLAALPEVVCGERLTVAGTATPGATLRLHDGDLALTAQADAAGDFAFDLPLIGPGFHLIRVAAVASDGREGASAQVVVRVDCESPAVERVELDRVTGVLRITLSEPVDPATAVLGSSVRLFDADGVERGAESLTATAGDTVLEVQLDPAADAWWRDAAVRVQVGPPLADDQGNTVAGVFQTVLFPAGEGGLAGGFLYGEAWDDASGRPLANAVAALYVAGSALPGTVPAGSEANATAATVTDARGRFTLVGDVAPGRYVLELSAPGRARVHRRLSLEPGVGAVTFDSRLTPLADPAGVLDPVNGGSFAHPAIPALNVTFDPNAVAAAEDLTVTLTPRSGQGLPDLLPLGWTPAAVAELRLETAAGAALPEGEAAPFAAGAVRLELPLPAWHQLGDELIAVRHHAPSGAWLTLPAPQVLSVAGGLIAEIEPTGPGTVALVVPDAGDQPPRPEPGPGHALAGSPLPETVPDLTATLSIDPPSVLPTGRATARVDASSADAVTPWPSGLAVQAWLEERLVLADGGVLLEAPVVADVLLYRCGEGVFGSPLSVVRCQLKAGSEGAAGFVVSPSPRAAQVLLEVGWETVKVFPFPETLERGQTVGATGGTVTSADGVELVVPEGAVPVRTPVEVRGLSADEIAALPVVAGFDTVAAVRIDLDGRTLAREATLKMPVPAGVATDAAVVLAEWMEFPADGRGGYARLASRMGRSGVAGSVGERLVGEPEAAGSELPLEGIVREGLYLVLVAQQPIGYATGFVRSASGLGLADSRVTATGLGTADLSRPGGRYAVPVPVNPGAVLSAQHPSLDERATAGVPALVAGEVVVVDLQVIPVPPTVTGLQPADGALDVTVGANLQVTFSEALDPATVGEGTLSLEVADAAGRGTGAYVPGTVSLVNGATVLFQPTLALPAGYRFVAHFAGGVRDAGGVPYQDGPVDWRFTTSTVAAPGGQVHPERFHITIPVDGVSRIWADPGAVPDPQWTISPILVNTATAPITVGSYSTSSLAPDALVPITIGEPPTNPITLDSEVWARVYDPTGTLAETFRLGPFASEDGLAFVAPAEEPTTFTTAEGIQVDVPEGAFDEATLVRITLLDPGTLGVAAPEGLTLGAFIQVDFEGEANETLRLKVPAPEGVAAGADVFMGAPVNLPWGKRLRIMSYGRVVDDGGALVMSNARSLQPELAGGQGLKGGGLTCEQARDNADGPFECFLESLLLEFRASGAIGFFPEVGLPGWTLATGSVSSLLAQNDLIYEWYHDAWFYMPGPVDRSGHYVLPVPEGTELRITRRDAATGWILDQRDLPAIPSGDEELVDLGELGRMPPAPPRLLAASPFELIRFSAPPEGRSEHLRLEIVATTSDGASPEDPPPGVLTLSEDASFALPSGTGLGVYDLSQATGGVLHPPSPICGPAPPWGRPLQAAPGGDLDDLLLVLGSGELDRTMASRIVFQFDRKVEKEADTDPDAEVAVLADLGRADECRASEPGRTVLASVTLSGDRTRLIVEPGETLPGGHLFRLRLTADRLRVENPEDPATPFTYRGPREFFFATRNAPGAEAAHAAEAMAGARDLLQIGNLMVVAGDDGSLFTVDLSPIARGLDEGQPPGHRVHSIMSSMGNQVRSLATDGHGRVFVNVLHGSTWGLTTVTVEEMREAAAACGETPAWAQALDLGCFVAAPGGVRVAAALSASAGTLPSELLALQAMPVGTPVDLDVVVNDEVSDVLDVQAFFEEHGASEGEWQTLAPDERGFYSFDAVFRSSAHRHPELLEGSGPCDEEPWYDVQRVTVQNLTTGQSWSFDIPDASNTNATSGEIPISARLGDRLQVRYNLRTLGYVAILGSGLTVVDLNRAYRNPATGPSEPGGGQCGRRLGTFEGEMMNLEGCGQAGLHDGIAMTTAVAVLGGTGVGEEPRRGAGSVDTYSPLMHQGIVHTTAPQDRAGNMEAAQPVSCLSDWLRDAAVASDVPLPPTENPDAPAATIDLMFLSLAERGVGVWDVRGRTAQEMRRLTVEVLDGQGHAQLRHDVYRLQVEPELGMLLTGGLDERGRTFVDLWDLRLIGAWMDGRGGEPRPFATLDNVPWVANHLGLDRSGTGLLSTWDGGRGPVSFITERPRFVFTGLYGAEDDPGAYVTRPLVGEPLLPLGVPMNLARADAEANRDANDRERTAAFKLRVALPGSLGEVVTARVESLRMLPDERHLAEDDLGPAMAPPGGECWPAHQTLVTMRRLGTQAVTDGGRLELEYNLFESDEIVVLLADSRAQESYTRQGEGADEAFSEQGQCRRCQRPQFLESLPEGSVKELLAAGPYLRATLSPCGDGDPPEVCDPDDPDADDVAAVLERLETLAEGSLRPIGTARVEAWADAVPSPAQVSLAEPALNPAVWSPGEAGVAVKLGSGELELAAVDHAKSGAQLAFILDRSYRSGALGYGPLGAAGWSSRLFAHLRHIPSTDEVEYHDGRGNVWRFLPPSCTESNPCGDWAVGGGYPPDDSGRVGGEYVAPQGLYLRLMKRDDGGWNLYGRHNDSAIFDAQGRLVELRDRHARDTGPDAGNGSILHLAYDVFGRLAEVVDDIGRRYTFAYDEEPSSPTFGLLTTVTDFAGREIAYEYDDQRRLEKVRLPEVESAVSSDFVWSGDDRRPTLSYAYHDTLDLAPAEAYPNGCFSPLRLAAFWLPGESPDPPGNLRARAAFNYDQATGRVSSVSFPGSGWPDSGARVAWEISPEGSSAVVLDGTVTVTPPWNGDHASTHDLEYTIDRGGRTAAVDEIGVPISAADGSTTTARLTTEFGYADDGRLTKTTRPDGSEQVQCYSDSDDQECASSGATSGCGDAGPGDNPDRMALANVVRLAIGDVPDAGTGAAEWIHEAFCYGQDNLPTRLFDPIDRGIELPVARANDTAYALWQEAIGDGDLRYQISNAIAFDGRARTVQLALGQLAGGSGKSTPPSAVGPTLFLGYGLPGSGPGAELLETMDLGPMQWSLDYDAAGNVAGVGSSFGAQSFAEHDEWDRPFRTISGVRAGDSVLEGLAPGGGCGLGTGDYDRPGLYSDRGYDAAGHVEVTRRCQDAINPATGQLVVYPVTTFLEYNAREQLVEVRQSHLAAPGVTAQLNPGAVPVLRLEYDGLGRLERRLVHIGNGTVFEIEYGYDAAGRPSTVQAGPLGQREAGYDILGRVNYRTDGDEGTWFGVYDGFDRLVEERFPTGAVTCRTYDPAGNLTEETTRVGTECPGAGRLLAKRSAYFTSFGEPDLEVVQLVDSDELESDDLLITRRFFDAAGRTTEVASGPASELGVDGLLSHQLDGSQARRLARMTYHPLTGQLASRAIGGILGTTQVPGEPPSYEERYTYDVASSGGDGSGKDGGGGQSGELVPWATRIQALESVPGETGLVPTVFTDIRRDLLGRPVEVVSSDGSRSETLYDRSGGAIQTRVGGDTTTSWALDSRGKLLRLFRPDGRGSTGYAYTLDGRVLREEVEQCLLPASCDGGGTPGPLWATSYGYDGEGGGQDWLKPTRVQREDGSEERFTFADDGLVDTWTTRDGVTVAFEYDRANRLETRTPSAGGALAPSLVPVIGDDDVYGWDEASRLTSATLPGQSGRDVAYAAYDLAGRPASEQVGSRQPLGFQYDPWGGVTGLDIPVGLTALPTDLRGHLRDYDSLGRMLTSAGGGLSAGWLWGGANRLYGVTTGIDPAVSASMGTATRFTYYGQPGFEPTAGDPGATWRPAAMTFGSATASAPQIAADATWGAFALGWRGTADIHDDGAKVGRRVLSDPIGLLAGLGWSWDVRPDQRLWAAFAGDGSVAGDEDAAAMAIFRYGYGGADQLERTTYEQGGQLRAFEAGEYGRPRQEGWGYDASGRRTEDDRFRYRWDWRGRLREVEVLAVWEDADGEPVTPETAGHRVTYAYDALGRLHERLHTNAEGGMVERRQYVWEGQGLVAELGFEGFEGANLRWRRTYLPGPSGLDDQVQVRVEEISQQQQVVDDRVYTILRDELGTVIGLVDEDATPPGDVPAVVVRYLYTPYGEAHAESGPELRAALFDRNIGEVTRPGGEVVTQAVADPELAATGAIVVELSTAADAATVEAGLAVVDVTEGRVLTLGADWVVGVGEDRPSRLVLLAPSGWLVGHELEVRVTGALQDEFGRTTVGTSWATVRVLEPGAVSVRHDRLAVVYDSVKAAGATVGDRLPGGQNLLFQGLWTDPVSGISYARNRWYDARSASWLSEDPMGAVDSVNLYAFVGWGPHGATDPMGLFGGFGYALDINSSYGGPDSPEVLGPEQQAAREAARRRALERFLNDAQELEQYIWNSYPGSEKEVRLAALQFFRTKRSMSVLKASEAVGVFLGPPTGSPDVFDKFGEVAGRSSSTVEFLAKRVNDVALFVVGGMVFEAGVAAGSIDDLAQFADDAVRLYSDDIARSTIDDLGNQAALTWRKHEILVARELGVEYSGSSIGRQVTLDVVGPEGQLVTIRIDNCVMGNCGRLRLIDAKFSEVVDLSDEGVNLSGRLTGNQRVTYRWITSGEATTAFPRGANAVQAGLEPGTPVILDPVLEIRVNSAAGTVIRRYSVSPN